MNRPRGGVIRVLSLARLDAPHVPRTVRGKNGRNQTLRTRGSAPDDARRLCGNNRRAGVISADDGKLQTAADVCRTDAISLLLGAEYRAAVARCEPAALPAVGEFDI